MVKFTEVIDASIEWTALVLFRPFKPKKWLILGFVALMAGYTVAGCNLNPFNLYNPDNPAIKDGRLSQSPASNPAEPRIEKPLPRSSEEASNNPLPLPHLAEPAAIIVICVIAVLIILAVIIGIVMMWLGSCFTFVFLEDAVRNDASIKAPFRENKKLGKSLFLFRLAFGGVNLGVNLLVIVMCILALIKLGVFDKAATIGFVRIFLACLPYVLILLLLIFIGLIIHIIAEHFVSVVMFRDKIKFMLAWQKTLSLLSARKADFVAYIFIIMGLHLCSGIIYGVISWLAVIGIIFPVGILAVLFYFLYQLVPATMHILYFTVLFIIAAPILLFLSYCLSCLSLPFGVFFRTLSLKFIGRLDQRYNLFKLTPNEEVVL